MALTFTRVGSQILADAAPAAGAVSVSPEHDIGDGAIVNGAWIYTTIGASGLAATPTAGGRFVVRLYPRGATASGAGAANHDNDVLYEFEHELTRDGAYEWADFCEGPLPRYTKVGVTNLTDQAVTASQLDVSIEYVAQTTP